MPRELIRCMPVAHLRLIGSASTDSIWFALKSDRSGASSIRAGRALVIRHSPQLIEQLAVIERLRHESRARKDGGQLFARISGNYDEGNTGFGEFPGNRLGGFRSQVDIEQGRIASAILVETAKRLPNRR